MRFPEDCMTSRSPIAQTVHATGAAPLQRSDRWLRTGVEIGHWRMQGPRQFSYGQQSCHSIAFVHRPLKDHRLFRNNRLVRHGQVDADRFRLSTPGDDVVAEVTTPDIIEMTHIYISPAALDSLAEDLAIPNAGIRLYDPSWDMRVPDIETTLRLLHTNLSGATVSDWSRLELLALFAVSTLLRGGSQRERSQPRARKASVKVGRAAQFMKDNLSRPIRLQDIAEAACTSPFHLCRIFSEEFGTTPYSYLQERRLSEAKRLLLETGFGLDEIAFRTGFASAGSLGGALRRRYGMSPARLRQH